MTARQYSGTVQLPFTNKSSRFFRVLGYSASLAATPSARFRVLDAQGRVIDEWGFYAQTTALADIEVNQTGGPHGIVPPQGQLIEVEGAAASVHGVYTDLEDI